MAERIAATMELDDGWWSVTIPAWDITTYVVDEADAIEALREAVAFELDADPNRFEFTVTKVTSRPKSHSR